MSTLNIDRCGVRDTAARKGRASAVTPGPTAARHLRYGHDVPPQRVRVIIAGQGHLASAGIVLHSPSDVIGGATTLDGGVVLVDIFTPIREDFPTT